MLGWGARLVTPYQAQEMKGLDALSTHVLDYGTTEIPSWPQTVRKKPSHPENFHLRTSKGGSAHSLL